jgi:hypothetical protein
MCKGQVWTYCVIYWQGDKPRLETPSRRPQLCWTNKIYGDSNHQVLRLLERIASSDGPRNIAFEFTTSPRLDSITPSRQNVEVRPAMEQARKHDKSTCALF